MDKETDQADLADGARAVLSFRFRGILQQATYSVSSNVVTVAWRNDRGAQRLAIGHAEAGAKREARRLLAEILNAARLRGEV